ncbi:glycerophosphodiester phosphodiesterase family protein [Rhizobium halophytocola]|uniref:Glycerophosphoryl diester phosphodiesterase n=1 Tax=Rhizobium halophytocola TaxID=735519 RepID=A0ABS4DVT3_9HYPH|nr:glycerophosphodiester phosphodiesterase family protein [Rhizobium halophytocola]MBP1849818.1 glycerophosphoryl diester phosphodiesterase [Rhizobium halophytocola]
MLAITAALWLANTSAFMSFPDIDGPRVIAHRGEHQLFNRAGLTHDTCTATRILPPTHGFLENTLPSMRAAFEAGADVVELDVHLTPDKVFAVLHDWTLDCRTNLTGVTEDTPFAALKTADVGYGYTADGGQTFPFRGKGIGMLPSLDQVFATFPDGHFLVNFKSRRIEEGTVLAARLSAEPDRERQVFGVYGGGEPTTATLAARPKLRGYTAASVRACLLTYLKVGWSGYVPQDCRNTLVPVPINYAHLLWGWPQRFYARMQAAGSDVIVIGAYQKGDFGSSGIDTLADWTQLPAHFPGYVWTNRIEDARRLAKQSGACGPEAKTRICR